jgi:hypothetical protein
MTSVILSDDVNRILEIVRELRSQGYAQGVDFDFEFHKTHWDQFTNETTDRYTKFIFHTEEISMLFALKYN